MPALPTLTVPQAARPIDKAANTDKAAKLAALRASLPARRGGP